MLPKYHIALGALFALFLYVAFEPITLLAAITIFFASFLIDVDHYLYYVYRKKDLSLRRAYHWHKKHGLYLRTLVSKEKYYVGVHFFHGFEQILFLLAIGTWIHPVGTWIAMGFVFHLFLDVLSEGSIFGRFRRISFVYTLISLRNQEHIEARQ